MKTLRFFPALVGVFFLCAFAIPTRLIGDDTKASSSRADAKKDLASQDDSTSTPGQMDPDYHIAAQDLLYIDVFMEKDFSREYKVQANGKISFPLLGEVEVRDKTTTEIEKQLRDALGKDYLVDPQVSVTVKQYRQRTVNVLGEVNKAGLIDLPGERKFTIIEAIAAAGGLTRTASKSKIVLTRKGKTTRYRFNDLNKVDDPAKVVYVEPGDTINVGESVF